MAGQEGWPENVNGIKGADFLWAFVAISGIQ